MHQSVKYFSQAGNWRLDDQYWASKFLLFWYIHLLLSDEGLLFPLAASRRSNDTSPEISTPLHLTRILPALHLPSAAASCIDLPCSHHFLVSRSPLLHPQLPMPASLPLAALSMLTGLSPDLGKFCFPCFCILFP